MSIAGSYAESIYFETPYEVPGPCHTCCLRCPLPSIVATLVFIGGVVGFCATTITAFFLTEELFPEELDISPTISNWRFFMMIGLIIWGSLNLILAIIMVSCSCLGTGATRKEFVCRFRSRAKGRCQTWVMMLFIFFLLLIWMGMVVFVLLPLQFFSIQNRGQCQSCNYVSGRITECSGKIDLTQWALADLNLEDTSRATISGEDLVKLCGSPVLWWFCAALALHIMIIISLIHYLVNFSANFAKLRDRFKAGYIDRRTGTYLTRSDHRGAGSRASLNNSRASLRSKKRNGTAGRNGNMNDAASTISSVQNLDNDAEREPDEISLANMNPYYRSADPAENQNLHEGPPSYSAQAFDYEQDVKNHDDMVYGGASRSYRRGDEPTTHGRGDEPTAHNGHGRGDEPTTHGGYSGDQMGRGQGSSYKMNLAGYDDEHDAPQGGDMRYRANERNSSTFVTPYHDKEPHGDDYHSDDPSSLQSQVSQFRARQEYFI